MSVSRSSVSLLHQSWLRQVGTACCSASSRQLSVEEVFGNAAIIHVTDAAQSVRPAFSEQIVHAGDADAGQNLGVGHFVLPGYAGDVAETLQMDGVEFSPPSLVILL